MGEQIEAEEALAAAKERGDEEEIVRLQAVCDKETREAVEAADEVAREEVEADQINQKMNKLEDRKKKTQQEIGRLAKEEKKLKKEEDAKATLPKNLVPEQQQEEVDEEIDDYENDEEFEVESPEKCDNTKLCSVHAQI